MPKKQPLVSVFLPMYNHIDFAAECLDSILSQDYDNIEIVCGDDASTDGTQEILKKYKKKYPNKINLLLHKKNLGFVKNFNSILSECNGEYVVFFLGDDVMLPGKISALAEFMQENPDHSICYHDLEVFNSATNQPICKYSDVANHPGGDVKSLLTPGTFVIGPCIIFRRSAAPEGGFNDALSVLADWMFMMEVAAKGRVGYIDKVLSRYRRHESNISNKKNHYPEYFIGLAILRAKYPQYTSVITLYEGHVFFGFMINSFRNKSFDLAFLYANEAMRRGYKRYITMPISGLAKLRCCLTRVIIDGTFFKIFSWLDAMRKRRILDYKSCE